MKAVRTAGVVLLAVLILVVACTGAVGAQDIGGTPESETVIGSPDIDLSVQDNRIQPGESQRVTIQISNSGEIRRAGSANLERRVQTARNLRLEVDERRLPNEIELRSGPALVGSLPEGAGQPVSFTFEVSEDIGPGRYNIPVEISYDFTRVAERTAGGVTRYTDFSRERNEDIRLIVEDDAVFSASTVRSDVVVGDTGEFEVRLENKGSRAAYQPRVTISSEEGGVFFGGLESGAPSKTVGTDTIEPGETQTVSVTAGASDDLDPGMYPVDINVKYDTEGGVERDSRTMSTLLNTVHEQSFNVSDIESTLRVGEDGDLTGEITNEGPRVVKNAVVVFQPESRNINPKDGEYAVGELSPGESVEFDYRISVNSETEAGPRQSSVQVQYRNPNGDQRVSDSVDIEYNVGEERDEFELESDLSVEAGSSESAEIEITNIDNQTLTDIQAKMFTNDPLSSGDDEAFVSELEPGESETIVFGLSAGGGATEKTYPVSVDFRYDNERGDTKISDTYRVPVSVNTSEESSSSALIIVALVVLGAAGWLLRGRIKDLLNRD